MGEKEQGSSVVLYFSHTYTANKVWRGTLIRIPEDIFINNNDYEYPHTLIVRLVHPFVIL